MAGLSVGMTRASLLLAIAVLAPAAPVVAAQAPPAAPAADDYPPPEEARPAADVNPVAETTVATGTKLSADKVAQPVTVLTPDDLNRIGGADFTRVLAAIPGATWERYGAAGAYTGLHLRGAGVDDVLVMIDGVRMQDVAGIGSGFDFGTLTGLGIDRVDVLRGADSVVWGSGAIGGVIAITTPETKGVVASGEVGSRGTFAVNGATGVRKDRYALALNTGYTASDDIPGRKENMPGGFHQWRFGGRARYGLTDDLSLVAVARFADNKAGGNAFPLPFELAGNTVQGAETEQFSGRTGAHYERGAVTLDAGYALASTRRVYDVGNAGGAVVATWLGRSQRADLIGAITLPAGFIANFGADGEWIGYSSSFDREHRARIASGHGVISWYGHGVTLAAGARLDHHSAFGSHTSYNANASVTVREGLRLRTSFAQAFKSPTLYQLYSAYGNPALRPETGESYDAGVDYSGDDGRVRLAASLYHRDTRNLIARPTTRFANIGQTRAQGIELEAALVPSTKWRFSALYSYGSATSRTPGSANLGKDLRRRPRHALTTAIDWTSPFKGIVLGLDLRAQSASWDDGANTVRLGAGEVTTLRASLPLGNFIEFYARVENLFNDHHATTAAYGTTGRGLFGGIRVRL